MDKTKGLLHISERMLSFQRTTIRVRTKTNHRDQNGGQFASTTRTTSTGRSFFQWGGPTLASRAFSTTSDVKTASKSRNTNPSSKTAAAREGGEHLVVDAVPTKRAKRLPALSGKYEFPPWDRYIDKARRRRAATARILHMATHRVIEPPTLHLLAASACATLGIGLVEGTMLCTEWPFWESLDAGRFTLRYSLEQLFPSVVWETQDPKLVARALGLDPDVLLQDLSGDTPSSANLLLQTGLLASSRSFFAGFMMIAQLVRAATVSIGAFSEYERRVQLGKEPPILLPPKGQQRQPSHGLVVRLCGKDSFVTEVSMKTMGSHIFPVFEDPERVQFLVWKHSEEKRRPIYWRVRPGLYGSAYSWDRFPAEHACLIEGANSQDRILILEADATNGNDPLSLDESSALDLDIDDTSQGFRRILEQYSANGLLAGKDFRTLRVYLGNSMETATTGGGHSYTLRHRVRYAKEVDVLIDSRAPVLQEILKWCESVAGADRRLFFQTSSRAYFVNLKELLKEYGYEILDPLDLRMLHKMRDQEHGGGGGNDESNSKSSTFSLMSVLLDDYPRFLKEELEDHGAFLEDLLKPKQSKHEMLRTVAKMSKLPRLVHMDTTAATVNAVEALIAAGEVQAGGCCALLDRQEGVEALERTLRQKSKFVESHRYQWTTKPDEEFDELSGLQIICSSSIHDDLFRQVRLWARMGHSATDIQKDINARFKEILQHIYNIQREVGNDDDNRDKSQAGSGRAKNAEASQMISSLDDDSLPAN